MVADNCELRDRFINEGVIPKIANILDNALPGTLLVRNGSYTLSNLCRGSPPPIFLKIQRALSSLAKILIENDNEDIILDVSRAFCYISDQGGETIPFILETGCLPRLV
jgi:importin subunit alpha-6/7